MKKPTSSNNSDKGGPSKARPKAGSRKATAKKPVTIDLKAETVPKPEAKPAAKDAPKVEASKPAASKVDAAKSESAKTEPAKSEPAKADTPRGSVPKASSTPRVTPAASPSVAKDDKPTTTAAKVANTKAPDTKPASAAAQPAEPASKPVTKTPLDVKPAPAAKAKTPAKEKSGGAGFGSMLIAACLGGGIVLAGSWLLSSNDTVDEANFASTEALTTTRGELDAQIASLREQLAEAQAAVPAAEVPDTSAITDRIAALETRLDTDPAAAEGAAPVATVPPELTTRIDTLDASLADATARLSALQSSISSGNAGEDAGLAALNEQVTALDARITELADTVAQAPTVDADAIAALSATLPALRSTVAENDQQLTARLDEASSSVEALRGTVTGIEERLATTASLPDDVAGLRETAALLDERLTQIAATVEERGSAIEQLSAATSELQSTSSELQERVAAENGLDRKAAQAVAAAALKSEIDRGQPFTTALANLEAVATDTASLDGLRPYAETGVPTVAQLDARFDGGVSDAIAAVLKPAAPTDLRARLLVGITGLVQTDAATSGDPNLLPVAAIGTALNENDAIAANSAWQALPDDAKAASEQFGADLAARAAANGLIDSTVRTYLLDTASQ